MNTKGINLLWAVPLCLIASVGGSLVTMWAVSRLFDFSYNWPVVALLSVVSSAAAIAVSRR